MQRLIWNGIELFKLDENNTAKDAPPGTVMASYMAEAMVDSDLRRELLEVARGQDAGIVMASRKLFDALGKLVDLRECVAWLKAFIDLVKEKPNSDRSDTSSPGELPSLFITATFFVRPDEVQGKPGWRLQGAQRMRAIVSRTDTPAKPVNEDAMRELDKDAMPPVPSGQHAPAPILSDSNSVDI